MDLDSIDFQLLAALQEDGQTNNRSLAAKVALSPSTTLGRIRRLFREGYIRRVTAILNPEKLAMDLLAFLLIDVDYVTAKDTLVAELAKMEEVQEIHTITGDAFFLVKLRTAGRAELNDLISSIAMLPGVRSTRTMIGIATFKESTALRLPAAPPADG